MRLLVLGEKNSSLAAGFARFHEVVTACPESQGQGDLVYDPNAHEFEDLRARLPVGFDPDAVVVSKLDYSHFVWGVQDVGVPVIALASDYNLCFEALLSGAAFVRLFICNERLQSDRFAAAGVNAMHVPWFGLDWDRFKPSGEPPRWDVVFAGNLHPHIHRRRGKLLEKLLSAPGSFDVRVRSGVYGREYVRFLSRGRMVFNYSVRGELNMRLFEALGVRRLLLVEDSNEEALAHFEDRKHLVAYNEENLIGTVEYYLSHPGEREAIALAGHEEALARHRTVHKAEAIAREIGAFCESPTGPEREKEGTAALHRKAALVYLQHGRLRAASIHAEKAASLEDSPESSLQVARVLGSISCAIGHQDRGLLERFYETTESVRRESPGSVFAHWNVIELEHRQGRLQREKVRGVIDGLLSHEMEVDGRGGPLMATYDAFRVAWEESFCRFPGDEKRRLECQRNILLSRAYELLGDEESRGNHLERCIEAYGESLGTSENGSGYVRHKLASAAARLGKISEARRGLKKAINEEPFFVAARRDLAALELNSGRRDKATSLAEESLLVVPPAFSPREEGFMEILDCAGAPDKLHTYRGREPILWEGFFFNITGYARETALIIEELLKRDVPILLHSREDRRQPTALSEELKMRFEERLGTPAPPFLQVLQYPAQYLERREGATATICRTTFEADRLPKSWVEKLSQADRVWVTSEFTKAVFERSEVPAERIAVIPNPVGEFPMVSPEIPQILNKKRFNFLSVFEWRRRKGWDILIQAFVEEFGREDDVSLVLRSYSLEDLRQIELHDVVREFIRKDLGRDPDSAPEILFVDETLSYPEVRGLYQEAQAFVLPSRGEGFGRTYLEAITAGLPTIATRWGGHLDFLSDDNAYLIDIEGLERVRSDSVYSSSDQRWAKPSVDHLRQLMRRVYEDPEEGQRKARRSAGELLSRFNVRRVANQVVDEMNELLG